MSTYSRNLAVMMNWEEFPFFPSNYGFTLHYHNNAFHNTFSDFLTLNEQEGADLEHETHW